MANFLTGTEGWRSTYGTTGLVGLALGVTGLLILEDPKLGAYDTTNIDAGEEIGVEHREE